MKIDFKRKMIGLSMLAGVFFWILDAVVDVLYERKAENFFQYLFSIQDIFVSIIFLAIFISFGVAIFRYMDKTEKMDKRYSNLFSSINDAIFVLEIGDMQTHQYRIHEVNRSASVMFGYQREELLQLSFSDIMTSKSLPEISSLAEALREDKHIVFETELERKDGANLVAEISVYPGDVSGNPGALLIVRDITMRKRSEEALLESEKQLGILASQLINAQEAERQRISVGLHDELGQALMHLKFKLGSTLPTPDAGGGLLSSVDEIIEYVRRLSRELSPSVLEELGLTSSIHYLVEEFCGHFQINCNSIEVDEIDHIFSFETQLNIFRIFQECLTNAARHAQATSVSVAAKERGDHAFFKLEDDGKGFDIKQGGPLNDAKRGIGISAMRQRVRMAGGTLEISSTEGMGTRVAFTIPIAKGA